MIISLLAFIVGFVLLGFFYRISIVTLLLTFIYVELIDITNYLNHYYFVSLVSFMMIFMPCAKSFSLDNKLFKRPEAPEIPRFFIFVLQWWGLN